MPALNIILDGTGAWPDLAEKQARGLFIHTQGDMAVAALPGGCESGAPSVSIRIDLPNGQSIMAETTLALWLTAADAFRAKYGDPRGPAVPVPPPVPEGPTVGPLDLFADVIPLPGAWARFRERMERHHPGLVPEEPQRGKVEARVLQGTTWRLRVRHQFPGPPARMVSAAYELAALCNVGLSPVNAVGGD